jgi:molybdopterin-binding protein
VPAGRRRVAAQRRVVELVRIGAAAKALGVSADTLRRWERAGRIEFVRQGGQRFLPAETLASLLRTRAGAGHSSARNRLAGVVVGVEVDGVMAKVELACGPYRIVSLMSREAAEELALEPGADATAVVKSTTVIIER